MIVVWIWGCDKKGLVLAVSLKIKQIRMWKEVP